MSDSIDVPDYEFCIPIAIAYSKILIEEKQPAGTHQRRKVA